MNFAEQLNEKKNLKVIAYADEFLEIIKPKLIDSAEKGYSAYEYSVDTQLEKDKLQLYSDKLFVEQLNKKLDGIEVVYEKRFVENLLFKGYGWFKHHLIFKW